MWSIGELAEHAGVTVKTVRFYSDRGLLPEAARSPGGHRRYGPDALDRLRLIRSLRALDLPVPDVGRVVLDEDDGLGAALENVVAGRLRELGTQMTALRWREAALHLLRDCPPGERAERLRLVGAVSAPPSTAAPARFWKRWLPARFPARLLSSFLEQAVPQPPDDPTPEQVLAFARLHALVSGPCLSGVLCQPTAHRTADGWRPAVLYEGLTEAYALAAPELRAGRAPSDGEALDCFVTAYARALGVPDTSAFRRRLSAQLASDPRIDRYWELTAVLISPASGRPEPTPGTAHDWLLTALDAELATA
ncbi:MerR family transcriptional regulator [Streptomyces ficellus]|uniref:MerR family transcriptional regulator n=1 Tax=Streptomyces ficellus TaxID=1977088 RepID=A0A6I6FLQ8_9ACTN|nr:MerR family transcriptional regulator [Streptomyces ficellus]